MGTGDWNDGMNKVGAEGKGESVWNGWFFVTVLSAFAELAERRGQAADANWCISYLTRLVKENNLPPKILIFHRFTKNMLTDARKIHPTPEVQFVLDMDGWGPVSLKTDSYKSYVANFPVEFTGFKLFYKNDTRTPRGVKLSETQMMTPRQVLAQKPSPIYIQYQ